MWISIVYRLLIISALTLIIISNATNNWQNLGINKSHVHTNIGLWKTCTSLLGKTPYCNTTKANNYHRIILYIVRIFCIINILILGYLVISRMEITLIAINILLSGLVLFLYSSQLENYFSYDFDSLMYSKYGYSYYIQALALLVLLLAIIICFSQR